MSLARAREINAILVTELSRWGRSTQDLVQTAWRAAGTHLVAVALQRRG
jgi:putative DNA-invertase from lambdoid prophage Rac